MIKAASWGRVEHGVDRRGGDRVAALETAASFASERDGCAGRVVRGMGMLIMAECNVKRDGGHSGGHGADIDDDGLT